MRHKHNSGSAKSDGNKVNSSIAFVKRVPSALAIAFFTFILISVFTVKSTYSAQSCQNIQTSIKIVDESGVRFSGASLETLQDSHFKTYVTAISKHISTKIEEMPECQWALKTRPEVELFFIYRPLTTPATKPFTLEQAHSKGGRYLDSPWVKLSISRFPKLIVRSVFIWSERQFLFDQALMSGQYSAPIENLVPLERHVYRQFLRDYTESVVFAPSPEAEIKALAHLAERIPPDILWLFRHAGYSTRGPFSGTVRRARDTTLEKVTGQYIELTKTLLSPFFSSAPFQERYESVLDLKGVFNLDRYRIDRRSTLLNQGDKL
jgi:hypothetical protein